MLARSSSRHISTSICSGVNDAKAMIHLVQRRCLFFRSLMTVVGLHVRRAGCHNPTGIMAISTIFALS